jgi:hypothetical protein
VGDLVLTTLPEPCIALIRSETGLPIVPRFDGRQTAPPIRTTLHSTGSA